MSGTLYIGLLWWLSGRESSCNEGDAVPVYRRSPGEGNGNLLQYSSMGIPIDRGTWQATVHVVAKELDLT